MFKIKLIVSLSLLLTLVLMLTATLLTGSKKTERHFYENQLASTSLNNKLQLIDIVDQFFYQQLSRITQGVAYKKDSGLLSEHDVIKAMDITRGKMLNEHQYNKKIAQPIKDIELQKFNQLDDILKLGIQRINKAHQHRDERQYQTAIELMSDVHNQLLDKQFRPTLNFLIEMKSQQIKEAAIIETETTAELTQLATLIAQFALLATIIIGIYLYRSITKPLSLLTDAAQAIQEGYLEHKIPTQGDKEFNHLADQFNDMSSTLLHQRQELTELNNDLENQVNERTKELKHANESLKKINDMRTALFADISHELRTPLTIIRGEAEVTLRNKKSTLEHYKSSLQQIVELASQLNRLVDDLFYLSRAESGSINYDKTSVHLDDVVNECSHEITSKLKKNHLSLEVSITHSVTILADRGRLKQLIHILLDNACRYSHDNGTIKLNLTTSADYATITVQDQGIGIPENELENAFERYYRGESAKKIAKEGAGIGLPLAKAIINTHGGKIRIKSQPGEGTTMCADFPLQQCEV